MEALRKLKAKFEEDPIPVMLAAAAVMAASARFIDAISGVRSKSAYARRSKRR